MNKRVMWSAAVVTAAAIVGLATVNAQPQPEPAAPSKPVQPVMPVTPATPKEHPVESTPAAAAPQEAKTPADPAVDAAVLDFKVKTIEGKEQDLAAYKGKVVVIVNVASACGFTKQYEGLEDLYEQHKAEGLVVLGFPANDFGQQEPGTDAEIREFCDAKFHVTFPMFAKISVKGSDVAPLYKKLEAQPKPIGGAPKWNFTKFVVDRAGNVVARFDAEKTYVGTATLEPGLVTRVEEELAKKK